MKAACALDAIRTLIGRHVAAVVFNTALHKSDTLGRMTVGVR